MTYYYKIANLTVAMDSFGRTVAQAQPYLTESCGSADITIQSNWKALQASQPHLSDEDAEYLTTGGSFYRQLLRFNGMMLHASAVVRDGKAYLFTAPCGTGKSTHTQLWLENFPDAFILNDDKPALRLENEKFYAYGTPWSGKTARNRNVRVELGGICVLGRGAENRITRYSGSTALHDILEQTVRPRDPMLMGKLLDILDRLLMLVPVWKLECNMEPQAAHVSYNAMSGKEENV